MLRIVRSIGLIVAGALLLLAWLRSGQIGALALIGAAAAGVGLVASLLATVRSRTAYWLFLVAGFLALLDLVSGYIHALFFLGSFMVLGALAAINEPDDDESLTIKNLMNRD